MLSGRARSSAQTACLLFVLLFGTRRLRAQQLVLVLDLVAHVARPLALAHAGAFALLEVPILAARPA